MLDWLVNGRPRIGGDEYVVDDVWCYGFVNDMVSETDNGPNGCG